MITHPTINTHSHTYTHTQERTHTHTDTHVPFGAILDVGFTVDPGEAWPAAAGVGVDVVGAGAAVLAGGALALVDLHGAAGAREAGQAAALEGVDAVLAGAPTQTRV
jgi:hypothetical protein